jgi:hypothetical protein
LIPEIGSGQRGKRNKKNQSVGIFSDVADEFGGRLVESTKYGGKKNSLVAWAFVSI